jgi:hypothetical protein
MSAGDNRLGTIIADHARATGTSAATQSALTSATADAYWLGAAVLLPIGIAALTLIHRRPAAVEAGAATPWRQPGRLPCAWVDKQSTAGGFDEALFR